MLVEKYGLVNTENDSQEWPAEVFDDLKKLKQGMPLAYLIGFVPFLKVKIDLSLRPLIPRAETEYWVGEVILRCKKEPKTCLDMFAGSGCVGLSLLGQWSEVRVDFVDIDQKCLDQVRINIARNKIDPSRIFLIRSDVFDRVEGSYDLILANPPYIDPGCLSGLPRSVKEYEPLKALLAGDQGLALIKKFLRTVRSHLNPGGFFVMEFNPSQKKKIEALVSSQFHCEFNRDQYGRWRFLIGRI